MKKLLFLLSILIGINAFVEAQNLALSGIITYERNENMHKQFKDDNSWSAERLKHMPKYKTDQFQLSFTSKHSLYKISLEDENPMFTWMKAAASNTVRMDLETKKIICEKSIYEGNYRITDSIPVYQWKMLGEYRQIAGYNCRKAATILLDSIYVIAFYTDEIPVSTGPESFSGLPGMILGIVVPRLNLTYFATKVETQLLTDANFELPKSKAKNSTFQLFNEEISKAMKNWGEYGAKILWKANL